MNTHFERTQDVYEHIDGYPLPPLIPLPDPDDFSDLESFGLRQTPFSRAVVRSAMTLSGYRAFRRQLPSTLADYLRTTNQRTPGLYAPVISATLAMVDDERELTPVQRAATLLLGAHNLYQDLMSAQLPPDEYRGQVLEMGQYPNFFGSSLWVEGKSVRLFKTAHKTQITVIVRNHYYLLELGGEGWENVSLGQLAAVLEEIIADANSRGTTALSPGLLTAAANRTQFAGWRALRGHPENAENLEAMRHSFLTLAFDLDDRPDSYADAALVGHSRNWGNRWHHASFQIVVFGNARACGICNFTAYLDGNTMVRGVAEIQKRAASIPVLPSQPSSQSSSQSLPVFTKLDWRLTEEMLAPAQKDIAAVEDDQQATFVLEGFGKEFFAQAQVRAVPTFVTALAMASQKAAGEVVRIEQFLALSKYCCMDLTTTNVTTPETLKFVDYMNEGEVDREQARAYLDAAAESQSQVSRRAREHYPTIEIIGMFLRTRRGLARIYAAFIFALAMGVLRLTGQLKPIRRQAVISHPAIYPEVPVVGRPGVRLPYAQYYGLHYQIMDDRTVVTMMPGDQWRVSNEEFISLLQESLERIKEVLQV